MRIGDEAFRTLPGPAHPPLELAGGPADHGVHREGEGRAVALVGIQVSNDHGARVEAGGALDTRQELRRGA